MTPEEYMRKRNEIVETYSDDIDQHESAGCFGDAEISRKWMKHELMKLDSEYRSQSCGKEKI